MTRDWDEATLLAYADDQLDPPMRAKIEAILARDSEAARLVALMRRSAGALAGAFDSVTRPPLPARLLKAAGARAAPPVRGQRGWFGRPAGLAWAASVLVAVAIGFGGGSLLGGDDAQDRFQLAGDHGAAEAAFEEALYQALTTGVAGQAFGYGEGDAAGTVTLGPAVDAGLGQPCRRFTDRGAASAEGLACQGPDGGWRILGIPVGE